MQRERLTLSQANGQRDCVEGAKPVSGRDAATGLTPEGRPLTVPDMEPSLTGRRVCPSPAGPRSAPGT